MCELSNIRQPFTGLGYLEIRHVSGYIYYYTTVDILDHKDGDRIGNGCLFGIARNGQEAVSEVRRIPPALRVGI